MRRNIARPRPSAGMAAAGFAVAAVTLAACGGGGASASGSSGGGQASAPAGSTQGSSGGSTSLKTSPLYYLTKLKKSQLCGVLSGGDAAGILGTPTIAPVYANRFGLGITCEWMKSAGSPTELYVGLSTVIDWQGAEAITKLLHTSPVTIDGHPGVQAGPGGVNDYAVVDVGLGGDHDPAAEFRAPTEAIAVKLAQTVTPRLLAIKSG